MMAKKSFKKKEGRRKGADKKDRQLETIIGVMLGVIAVLALTGIFIYSSNKFTYLGLEFKRVRYGSVIFYSTDVPVFDKYGRLSGYISANFRNDPRKLKDIPVDTNGEIGFLKDAPVYISMNPNIGACGDFGIAVTWLGLFLSESGIEAKSAFNDKLYARQESHPYVRCWNASTNTILMINSDNKTEIKETEDNCYELNFKDCEILKSVEKFALKILEQHMSNVQINKQN